MALWMAAALLAAAQGATTQPAALPRLATVVIETALGTIEVEVDEANAPVTAGNFLKYVDAKHYDGGQFHRTVTMDNQPDNDVEIEVIQASVNRDRADEGFGSIPLERTTETSLSHLDGSAPS
jgi:peptidyl-prolyl cis-trans isomerase A (cyclophilin A)